MNKRRLVRCVAVLETLFTTMSESFDQLDPNYVIAFEYSIDNLTQLLTELSAKGLHVLPRPGYDSSTLYAFTRVKEHDVQKNVEHKGKVVLETNEESGDAILRKICEPLKFVKSITRIHDFETRKKLDRTGSSLIKKPLSLPTEQELVQLERLTRNPRQALYFAYFRRYILWLVPLSGIGAFTGIIRPSTPWEFNIPYTVALLAWALLFVSSWIYKAQPAYGAKFGKVQSLAETSEKKMSQPSAVLFKKLCFIPVAVSFIVSLVSFQFFCFFVEIYITQFYSGPLSSILSLIPTVLICSFIPVLTILYNKLFVDKFVDWEDGPDPAKSKVEKNFVLTFFTSYMPLFITLFFYLPMGYKITPELRAFIAEWSFRFNIPIGDVDFVIDVKRYRNQFFYFIVTNQVIAVATENLVPIAIEKIKPLLMKKGAQEQKDLNKVLNSTVKSYFPRELPLWQKVNSYHVNGYGEFDVDENFRKLVTQFGFLVIFSIIWPLAPLVCLLFNYCIFKADLWRALKKCKPSSNPDDVQVNENNFNATAVSADPWNRILEFIVWVGATACPTLLMMYRYCGLPGVGLETKLEKRDLWYKHSPLPYSWTAILLIAVFSEHTALLSYAYLRKLFVVSGQKLVRGFVPASDLQEPPQIDLNAVVRETASFMEKAFGNKSISKSVEKDPAEFSGETEKESVGTSQAEKEPTVNTVRPDESTITKNTDTLSKQKLEDPPARMASAKIEPHTTERSTNHENLKPDLVMTTESNSHADAVEPRSAASLPPKTAAPEQAKFDQPVGSKPAEQQQKANSVLNGNGEDSRTPTAESTTQNSLDQGRAKGSSEGLSSAAGATLPETIPTSKNYHLRHDKNGNAVASLSSAKTSNSSVVKEQPVPKEVNQESLRGNAINAINAGGKAPVAEKIRSNEKRHDSAVDAEKTSTTQPRSLDPAKTITTLPQVQQVENEKTGHSPSKPNTDSSLSAAAAAAALTSHSNHSRTSSRVNAVQQFGRDVPALVNSTNTTEASSSDHRKAPVEPANSVKSKPDPPNDPRSSTGLKKGVASNKRASIDRTPKDSPSKNTEHKSKHKKGLLHKLKKKL